MSNSGTERVLVTSVENASASNRVYHTDPECSRLRGRYTTRDLGSLHDEVSHCSYCAGEWDPTPRGERRASLRDLLRSGEVETHEADPEGVSR